VLRNIGDCETFHHTCFRPRDNPYPWQLEALKGLEGVICAAYDKRLPVKAGIELVLIAARQAGKNEVNARLEARMLSLFSKHQRLTEIVKCAPTRHPQLLISKNRLKEVCASAFFRDIVKPEWSEWYICKAGNAKLMLLSADEGANSVGHTASLYCSADESQDISPEKYEKDFRPMTTSTGAPHLFSGTEWSEDSLLHQARLRAEEQQRKLGIRLVYVYPWWRVAEYNEAYGAQVQALIERMTDKHPLILSQYCCQIISQSGNMFDAADIGNALGMYSRREGAEFGRVYVAGVDFCAARDQDEHEISKSELARKKRDSTVATVAECTFQHNPYDNSKMPVMRIVDHLCMAGQDPMVTINRLDDFLFKKWNCASVVLDANGVGDGPSEMIRLRHPRQCKSFITGYASKSNMGHELIGMLKSGRMQMYRDDGSEDFRQWMLQFKECRRFETRGDGMMKWGAPTTKLHGEDVHDDYVLSAGYCYQAAERFLSMNHDPNSIKAEGLYNDEQFR
jgi:hypothetical protein